MSLPSHAGKGDEGGEEEGETSQNEDAHNDGGEVGQGLLLVASVAGGAVAVGGGAITGGGGAVAGSGGAIRSSGLLVCGGGRRVAGARIVAAMIVRVAAISLLDGLLADFKGRGASQAQSSDGGFSEHFPGSFFGEELHLLSSRAASGEIIVQNINLLLLKIKKSIFTFF